MKKKVNNGIYRGGNQVGRASLGSRDHSTFGCDALGPRFESYRRLNFFLKLSFFLLFFFFQELFEGTTLGSPRPAEEISEVKWIKFSF